MSRAPALPGRQAGLSYVEALAAVLLIAITLFPVMSALRGALHGAGTDLDATTEHYRLVRKLEDTLAEPVSALSAAAAGPGVATAYSDPGGTTRRRLVFISPYDADNADADDDPFTGTEADFMWVRVEIEGSAHALQSLRAP